MNDRNTEQQNRYLEEVCTCLHRAGFETQPLEDSQMPVYWNGTPLCRITGKGSVFYRREDVSTPQAKEALIRAEDITVRTLEYMTAMETAPQLKASGLEGDYRILADFSGTVLAGTHSKHSVQFVTWDWDYGRVRSAEGLSPHREISPHSDMAALPQQGAAPLAPLCGYPCTPTKTVHPPLASVPFLRVLLSYPGGDTNSHLPLERRHCEPRKR